jgi:hypothetical protein
MAQLIQICASQNDLFGLDDEGRVYQYNFNTSTWMHLGRGRSGQGESVSGESRASAVEATSHDRGQDAQASA